MPRYIDSVFEANGSDFVDRSLAKELGMFDVLAVLRETERDAIFRIGEGGSICSNPVVLNGMVYFGACDKNFYAVDAETGNLKWKFRTDDFIIEPVEISNGIIYLPSTDRNLYALSTDGNLLWKFRTFGPVASKPVVYKNGVYFGCSDYNLYKLNAFSGKLVWKFKTQGVASSSPFLSRNVIYFGSWDCCLYAVTTDGRLLWKFRTSSSGQAPVNLSDSHMESVGRNISGPLISDEPVTEGKRAERKSDYGKFSGNYLGENEDVLDITSMSGLVKQYGSSGKKYR